MSDHHPSRPNGDIVDALGNVPTAVISDVADTRCVMDVDIEPVWDIPRISGTAITVDVPPNDNVDVHRALTQAEAGDVVVVDAGTRRDPSVWGGLISQSAKHHGLAGAVIDGAVRDIEEIEKIGFPLLARSVNPQGPAKQNNGTVHNTIKCGGVSVTTGDVMICDQDGVAVIDQTQAEDVLTSAQAKIESEDEIQRQIKQGEYVYDILELDGS